MLQYIKIGLSLFLLVFLAYDIYSHGVTHFNSFAVGIFILAVGGEYASQLKKKRMAEEAEKKDL